MSAMKDWILENEDSLREKWEEKLSYMQDSSAHRAMLAASDRAFEEFCEEAFEDYASREPDDAE